MPDRWQAKVTELFKHQTGEFYNNTTFRMLGIPEWHGNKLLIDTKLYPLPESLMGVLWSKPLLENRIRVVSLVPDEQANKNYADVLTELMTRARDDGNILIQLEVRKSNLKAQNFYSKRQ